jgi:Amt family ammonium transporter
MSVMLRKFLYRLIAGGCGILLLLALSLSAAAQDTSGEEPAAEEPAVETVLEEIDPATVTATLADVETVQYNLDQTWVLLAGFLVFFMQAGFAFLESGMIRQSGVVNSMAENFFDALLTGIFFWAVGFGIAYGTSNGLFGTDTFFISGMDADGSNLNGSLYVSYFYQFAFAAAAGTIVTGATAERMNFWGKILYTVIIAAFIYPVVVHWVWSGTEGAFLYNNGYRDFAGSSVVHMVGGILALTGAIFIGPRLGRVWGKPPKGHNMVIATLGTFILWFGWYGFNVGSTLNAKDPGLMGLVTLNTTIAAAAGSAAAMIFGYARSGKWDLPAILNGCLAGLVGITAGCAYVSPVSALIIGLIAGVLVLLALDLVEKLKIDDAVGAFAVHGVCGAWGCLAIGLFGLPALTGNEAGLLAGGGISTLITQAVGVGVIAGYVTVTGVIMWTIVKALGILRIPAKAEEMGIDVYEHGQTNWPDVLPLPGETEVEGGQRPAPAVGD